MEIHNKVNVLHNFIEEDWSLIRPRYSRGPYIGGSEVPAIMECGHTSAYTLMKQKLGQQSFPKFDDPTQDIHWIIKRGNDLEPILIDDASRILGKEIFKPDCMIQHPAWNHMIADFDGITEDEWLVEVKTTGSAKKRDLIKMGRVPMDYMVQAAHYLSFPQFDDPNGRFKATMDKATYHKNKDDEEGTPYWVPNSFKGIHFVILHDWQRKPTIISKPVEEFWDLQDLVRQKEELFISMFKNGELPPPDGSESTTESMRDAFDVGTKQMNATPEITSIHTDYKEAKEKEKEFKEKASAARNKLQEMCGDDIKKIPGICSFFEKESFSSKLLKERVLDANMGHLLEGCTSKSTQFRVN